MVCRKLAAAGCIALAGSPGTAPSTLDSGVRLACWRAGWGFIRNRLTTFGAGKSLDAKGKPVRAFQESHCGTNNGVECLASERD